MNHVARHFRSLPDELLADAVLRLRGRLRALALSSSEIAAKVRLDAQDALDAALAELQRRDLP